MDKFKWTREYATNIVEIDKQHRELFEKIDQLAIALYDGKSSYYVKGIITFLDKYIEEHFELEEYLMKINYYPKFTEHVKQHEAFRIIFDDIKKDFIKKGGDTYLGIRIEREVRQWWENHVLKIDMLYVQYIKKI